MRIACSPGRASARFPVRVDRTPRGHRRDEVPINGTSVNIATLLARTKVLASDEYEARPGGRGER